MNGVTLRTAHDHELGALVAIDDDAGQLFVRAGLDIDIEQGHPFVVSEQQRWALAIERGLALVAADTGNRPVGFMILGDVDGEPYLDQLSVRTGHMQQGIGSMLVHHAISWSDHRPLWLTTYAHLPWNKPFYEKHGFVKHPEEECGAELCAILREQRAALPDPMQRIVMVRRCP
ncbi:GNAT family N-acetyltransferase [Vreelandella hamiltonii]|uniref:N-acetyltransferase domain-containing protein n=1 Tax=Halomonas johnsoniae TaxID=502832 RepID=A0ABQ2WQJ5_9GAMM|nr:GNAT family N-acetyltransferase [Halomonas johnsoniae]GGW65540.1 hypothetical protein GCM10007158_27870 [Halomonas johnsoniae]